MSEVIARWSERARQYGRRCVMDLSVPETQLDEMTRMQWGKLISIYRKQHLPEPYGILDFGCGTGRFSGLMADEFGVAVTAYDPCPELIALVPPHPFVTTTTMLPVQRFSLVWVLHVLGGLRGGDLDDAVAQICGAMRYGSVLILNEQCDDVHPGNAFWAFRPVAAYAAMFRKHGVHLEEIGGYKILDRQTPVLKGIRV